MPTTLNARDQPPAEVSDQRVSGLTGAVQYPPELRERAVRMVAEIRGQHDSEWAAISEVARLLGVGCAETV
ncbi:hypothetical protein ACNJL6_21190, partial [Mycobacterium tuberculosis]